MATCNRKIAADTEELCGDGHDNPDDEVDREAEKKYAPPFSERSSFVVLGRRMVTTSLSLKPSLLTDKVGSGLGDPAIALSNSVCDSRDNYLPLILIFMLSLLNLIWCFSVLGL
jgi:hypothetical protein